jgi:hypothetical protein
VTTNMSRVLQTIGSSNSPDGPMPKRVRPSTQPLFTAGPVPAVSGWQAYRPDGLLLSAAHPIGGAPDSDMAA